MFFAHIEGQEEVVRVSIFFVSSDLLRDSFLCVFHGEMIPISDHKLALAHIIFIIGL